MFSSLLRPLAVVLGAALALPTLASPLVRRDVIAPKITSPNAESVWPIGTVQTVTWDTSNFPPVSQITNILGQVILGFQANDSLNLDFNHPLAQNFNITDGSVNVTVPNVPPRDDYLIVLFGDSGNTSPAFSITRISAPGGNTSSSLPASSTTQSSTSSVNLTTPTVSPTGTDPNPPSPPFTGTSITSSDSSTGSVTGSVTTQVEPTDSSTSSAPQSTATVPVTVTSSSSSSGTSTALDSGTTSSGALSARRPEGYSALLCLGALSAFIML